MKTFRMIGMALVAVVLGFAMSSCENDDDVDPYKDYPQLIVGKWFNFSPEASVYTEFKTDGTCHVVGYDKHASLGFMETFGAYSLDGNKLTTIYTLTDGSQHEVTRTVEVTKDQFIDKIVSSDSESSGISEKVNYRVQESFDIKGNYSYLNSVARVVPAEGKTALQLPEGITFQGKTSIPVEMLQGERIIEAAKSFFADATFAADGKLEHQMGEETKHKNYTLDGNSLVFNLYEGSDVYKVNATAFPDEDGDRLFIIMPKQAAWMGGFVELIEKENTGLKMTEAQIKELETEFLTTFDTFTVILSLSKKYENSLYTKIGACRER